MTLVHTFVMSRVDYCNVVFTGTPKAITDKLHQVLNTAAHVVTGTRKFDHGLKQLIHSEFHWLDAPERIMYRLSMFMRRCLDETAPWYLAAHCTPVSATASRHHLRSAASLQFVVPSYSSEFIWTSGFLCRWPDDIELTAADTSHHPCLKMMMMMKDELTLAWR